MDFERLKVKEVKSNFVRETKHCFFLRYVTGRVPIARTVDFQF